MMTFFSEETRAFPMPSPMGIMDISAPNEKNPIPTTSRTAPSKNTMQVIGNTEDNASLIFSFNFVIHSPLSY